MSVTEEITAAEGEGPIHALDRALRKRWRSFTRLRKSRLSDYKVRVLDPQQATAARYAPVTSTDGEDVWSTVGVSTDIIGRVG